MKLTLTGPDDLGKWLLEDANGNAWPLVERPEDHIAAAAMFGWLPPQDATDEEIIENALDWLMAFIGEEIEAPQHIAEYFRELEGDDE